MTTEAAIARLARTVNPTGIQNAVAPARGDGLPRLTKREDIRPPAGMFSSEQALTDPIGAATSPSPEGTKN